MHKFGLHMSVMLLQIGSKFNTEFRHELINYFKMDGINPHIMCISKHHMKEQDMLHLTFPGYALGRSLCCKCIYRRCVHEFS